MTTLIGLQHEQRHACTDELHLPNCYNPSSNLTACACGDVWWVGQVGTWHSKPLHAPGHYTSSNRFVTGGIVGWDRYFLHLAECLDQSIAPDLRHVCGGRLATSYADAVRAVREGAR